MATSYKAYTYVDPNAMKNTTDYGTFSYNPLEDANYQNLAKVYNANGIKAANDTLGQAASLNGGYNTSWATSAAQQSRNDYNQQLASLIPELENNAYSRWNDQRNFDSNQWYQNMGLYLDAVGANNSAAANYNSDLLNQEQFAWQKSQAKKSGGGGSKRKSSGSGYSSGGYSNSGYSVSGGSSGAAAVKAASQKLAQMKRK